MVHDKKNNKFVTANFLHSIIVALTVLLLPIVIHIVEIILNIMIDTREYKSELIAAYKELQFYKILGIIFVSHIIIDFIKSAIVRRDNLTSKLEMIIFISDQIAHLAIILVVSCIFKTEAQLNSGYIFIVCLLLVNRPTGIMIGYILDIYSDKKNNSERSEDVSKLGRQLGYVERTVVFISIISDLEAIAAAVITLKGVLRISSSRTGQSGLANHEYFIYGNLVSFSVAVIVAIIFTM